MVEISGVEVGKVYNIGLKDYEAVITLAYRKFYFWKSLIEGGIKGKIYGMFGM